MTIEENDPLIETEDDTKPAPKRAKTQDPLAPISASILSQRDKFASEYTSNKPYPHVIFPDIFQSDFLDKVVEEIKQNSSMTFKESDLFKFYQSIDLANLKSSGPVLQLRDLLYSSEWRKFMEDVAGLPPDTLADRVDCACNCHTTGCHLLCHDDVITTRCLSYILYLTEEDWTEEEGGALELYPSKEGEEQKVPDASPSVVHRPLKNHLAMFKVEPGLSFHAVQEVFGSRPRLSLQGWYHYKDPSQMDHQHMPTLQMLKQTKGDVDDDSTGPGPYESFVESNTDTETFDESPLSKEDLEYLTKYLDATYVQPSEIKQINEAFQDESAVQLQNFFRSDIIPSQEALRAEDAALESSSYSRGVTEEWKLVGPPHKQRFLECVGAESKDTVGSKLLQLRSEVLQSPQFGRWLAAATNLPPPTAYRGRARRFRRGLDYTVAHHGLLLGPNDPPVLDATLCFVVDGPSQESTKQETEEKDDEAPIEDEEDESWESGNVGGFECYIEADDEEGADEEYNTADEDNTELLSVSANNNTLSLVLRDTGTMRFVKYVSKRAPSSRWDIAMEYQIPEDDETKEEEEEDEDEDEELEEENGDNDEEA